MTLIQVEDIRLCAGLAWLRDFLNCRYLLCGIYLLESLCMGSSLKHTQSLILARDACVLAKCKHSSHWLADQVTVDHELAI